MDKVIVITGAGAGLGKHLAKRFAADGDKVVLLGRTKSKVDAIAAEIGENAAAFGCDVTSPDSVRDAFAEIAEQHGKIDVLINNAAIYEPFEIEKASDAQIIGSLMTNLAGPIFTVRAALPLMDAGGHIINLSSESVETPFAMMSLYQSSKAGLERFTQALKEEVGGRGIRVTTVRAGQMFDEEKTFDIDPAIGQQFAMECAKRGIDLMNRPITHYSSVAELFHTLVNLPADLQTPVVTLEAYRA